MSVLKNFEEKNSELVAESYFKLSVMEKIFEIMESKGISQNELAKKMKVSKSHISRLLADDRNLTVQTIAKIFYALEEEPMLCTKVEVHELQQNEKAPTQDVWHVVVPYGDRPRCATANTSRQPKVNTPTVGYNQVKTQIG